MDTTGIVLVARATGGVGRRVVDHLRKEGRLVRVLSETKRRQGKCLVKITPICAAGVHLAH